MINFEGYHGTDNAHVRSIMTTGFNISTGDSHWLGDGVYFFLKGKSTHPENQAEQWAILGAWDKANRANKYESFGVLKAEISVEENNFLILTDPSGLEILEYLKNKTLEKIKRLRRNSKIKIVDGYLINFGRNEMGIPIDVVKGDVFIKLTKDERKYDIQSRIPNSTISSVFNSKCISNIVNIKTGQV